MKKSLQVFAFFVSTLILANGSQVFGQVPCSLGLQQAFGEASKESPVVLNRLGTSPQFGEIPKHTAESAFNHLAKVHKKNARNSKNEIDTFLKALGFSGFNDPAFNVSKITPKLMPAGQIGWMGAYSKGHKYKWSVLGKDFETFKIVSIDGTCHAYIMKKCGNVFYQPVVPPPPPPPTPVAFCKPQTLNFVGKGKIQPSGVINAKKILPVVASFNGNSLCVGDLDVPVRLTYDITVSGDVNYSKIVEVCDYSTGVAASLNYNLPIDIKYNLGLSEVNVGVDGKMNLAVNKKQYKSLKKVYKICPSAEASTSQDNCVLDPAAAKRNIATLGSPSAMVGGGKPGECVKQTLNFSGSAKSEDISSKITTQEVTLIGAYKKMGKLQKGETADKYMCLGTYSVPAKSCLQYALNGTSTYDQIIEVCDNGSINPNEKISLPFSMKSSITKQEVMVGDYGKVYMSLTKKQYKKLGKVFKRCCSDGSKGKC